MYFLPMELRLSREWTRSSIHTPETLEDNPTSSSAGGKWISPMDASKDDPHFLGSRVLLRL